jgi:hypothetical protein
MRFNYCAVNVTTAGTVVPPETALIVTCAVNGVAGVVVAVCCGAVDEEQPLTAAAAINRRARSDPPARCILRLKPANTSRPTGPTNAMEILAGDWNRWTE